MSEKEIKDLEYLSGSNLNYPIYGAGGGKGDDEPEPATEDPIGIKNRSDPDGNPLDLALSKSIVEAKDLMSEGPIEGFVSGELTTTGTAGSIGYDGVEFHPYDEPPNLSNARWLRSIYWNEVPLVDSNNQFNFQRIDVSFTKGTPNGAVLSPENPNLTVTRTVNERFRASPIEGVNDPANQNVDFAKTYRLDNPRIKSVKVNIRVSQLSRSDKTSGDVQADKIEYNIYSRAVFSTYNKEEKFNLAQHVVIDGHVNQGFIQTNTVNLDSQLGDQDDLVGWEIRLIRITPDSTSSFRSNQTFVQSLIEVFADTFTYPYSAVVRQTFDAEYFGQIPNRFFHIKGKKVKVPDNYDPIQRTYGDSSNADPDAPVAQGSDIWQGTFKTAWTNNPAWVYYDILTNKRYGLGNLIDEADVDKWTLYEIAKYCDTMVADGKGGVEPRFTANLQLTNRESAYNILNSFASIFRGLIYYLNGLIYTVQDKPKDIFATFTNANVINGEFNYEGTSVRQRHTVAIIRFNDPDNFFKPAIEYVEDVDGIRRFGINQTERTAFGVASRGQAKRFGKWILLSEKLNSEIVKFQTGLEGLYLRPGDVIQTFDFHRHPKRFGGRLYDIENNASETIVTLDDNLNLIPERIYNFDLITPTYQFDPAFVDITDNDDISDFRRSQLQTIQFSGGQVSTGDLGTSQITLDETFDTTNYSVTGTLIWTIELSSGEALKNDNIEVSGQYDKWRIFSIQNDEENQFTIQAIEHNPDKFDLIETGLAFQDTSEFTNTPPPTPSNLSLSTEKKTENTKIINYNFVVTDKDRVSNYYVYAKKNSFGSDPTKNNEHLIDILPSNKTFGEFTPAENGAYYFRVYSRNGRGIFSSSFAANNITVQGINPLKDVIISSLTLDDDSSTNKEGTTLSKEFDIASPTFQWQVGTNTSFQSTPSFTYRVTAREPSNNDTPSNTIFFEETGIDPDPANLTYQFAFDDNKKSTDGPHRKFDFVVEAMDSEGDSSAGGNFLTNVNANGDGDSKFTNSQGYDIVFVENHPVTGVFLTPTGMDCTESLQSGKTCTTQFISPEGNVVIRIDETGNDFTEVNDIEGGFLWDSANDFTDADVVNDVAGISRTRFGTNPGQRSIVIPAGLSEIEERFVKIAFYDSFDEEHINFSSPEDTISGSFSNTVKVYQKGLDKIRNRLDSLESNPNYFSEIFVTGVSGIHFLHDSGNSRFYTEVSGTDSGSFLLLKTDIDNFTFVAGSTFLG